MDLIPRGWTLSSNVPSRARHPTAAETTTTVCHMSLNTAMHVPSFYTQTQMRPVYVPNTSVNFPIHKPLHIPDMNYLYPHKPVHAAIAKPHKLPRSNTSMSMRDETD